MYQNHTILFIEITGTCIYDFVSCCLCITIYYYTNKSSNNSGTEATTNKIICTCTCDRNALMKCKIFILNLNMQKKKKTSGMVLKSPQLTISIKLITANFEYTFFPPGD